MPDMAWDDDQESLFSEKHRRLETCCPIDYSIYIIHDINYFSKADENRTLWFFLKGDIFFFCTIITQWPNMYDFFIKSIWFCRKEAEIIKRRFGIDDGISLTLDEIGRESKVTRERIRQVEGKALNKLRYPSRSHSLKLFLDKDY